ncbi:MAG: hypothetical protein ABJ263_12790 [Tateyamaria sp.]|uniref:hypothetical protein n=2 Tax=Tateyamaria sp. TaxID=1929288 RepID=UPI00327813CB
MNKALNSGRRMTLMQDPFLIGRVAMGQLDDVSGGANRMVTHLFLHEPFALGYAIGFAKQAFRHAKNENQEVSCETYVLCAISQMLGDERAAASFVSFADTKKGNRTFERGYDVGLGDMESWCLSHEERLPGGLVRYLDMDGTCSRIQRI